MAIDARSELPIDTVSPARYLIGKALMRELPEGVASGLLRPRKKITGKARCHPTCLFIRPRITASRLYGPAPAETTMINMKA